MNTGAVFCLAVGLWCSPLAAQQAVIASGAASPSLPAILTMTPAPELSRATRPAALSDLELSSFVLGFPANPELYEGVLPRGPANVCTQALPPVLAAHPSDYAFDHLQFTAAAFKSAFTTRLNPLQRQLV